MPEYQRRPGSVEELRTRNNRLYSKSQSRIVRSKEEVRSPLLLRCENRNAPAPFLAGNLRKLRFLPRGETQFPSTFRVTEITLPPQADEQQVPPLRRPLRLRSGSGPGRNDKGLWRQRKSKASGQECALHTIRRTLAPVHQTINSDQYS